MDDGQQTEARPTQDKSGVVFFDLASVSAIKSRSNQCPLAIRLCQQYPVCIILGVLINLDVTLPTHVTATASMCFAVLLLLLLNGFYRTLSLLHSKESQVQNCHVSISERTTVQFRF